MQKLKTILATVLLGLLFIGLPISLFFWSSLDGKTRDRLGAYIGVAIYITGGSALGSVAAARICSARSSGPAYDFGALAWRGFLAGVVASVVVAFLPRLFHFDGGIYIWPLVIGAPTAFLYVVGFHLKFNRR